MKIKNLKIFNKLDKKEIYNAKKDFKFKVAAVFLGGVMFLPTISSCSKEDEKTESVSDNIQIEEKLVEENDKETDTKVFEPGEHIVLVIDEVYLGENQVDYHEGYEIIDATSASVGKHVYSTIYYSNVVPVECKYSRYDNMDQMIYEDFGTPTEKNKTYTKNNN